VEDAHISWLSLLVATIDGDAERAHQVIADSSDPAQLAHHSAWCAVEFVPPEDRQEWRAEIVETLRQEMEAGRA
jgi:hypothetical protein